MQLATLHEWVQAIFPDVPPRLDEGVLDQVYYFRNSFTGATTTAEFRQNEVGAAKDSASYGQLVLWLMWMKGASSSYFCILLGAFFHSIVTLPFDDVRVDNFQVGERLHHRHHQGKPLTFALP